MLQISLSLYTFTPAMKFHTFILSLAILIYVAETIQIPLMVSSPKKSMCCKKVLSMSCKVRIKMHKKMNEKSNSCDGNNCVNCPLINTFTLQPSYSITLLIAAGNGFLPIEANTVTGIYWQVWRPPNVSQFFQRNIIT